MKHPRTVLILLLVLALIPLACAFGEEDLAGRWTSEMQGDTATLLLHSGGAFIMLYEEDGNVTVDTGSWSREGDWLRLMIQGGEEFLLEYALYEDVLSARRENEAEWKVFTREPWQPTEGLAGDWRGKDVNGDFLLTLRTDSSFSFDYLSGDPIGSGYYAEYGETLYLVNDNNTYLAMGYTLNDGGLNIRNQSTGDEFPLSLGQVFVFNPTYAPETEVPMPTPRPIPGPTAPASVQTPAAVSGLAGSWQGTDASGARVMTFTESGRLTLAYQDKANAGLDKKGTYTSTADAISAEYTDGTRETYRYLLLGDSLLISDALLQNPVTYSRVAPPDGAVDPALVGTWAGSNASGYFEFTFHQDGTYSAVLLPNEEDSHTGTFNLKEGRLLMDDGTEDLDISYSLEGERLLLDKNVEMYRQAGPLKREPLPETVPTAAADPALTGVWGGMEQDIYVEHIFLPDGRYLRFTPLEQPDTQEGNYIASGGALAILTREGSSQGTYAIKEDGLTLSFAGGEETAYVRRDGILKRPE